jgi:hypothetical protein
MAKKRLDTTAIANELEGSAFFSAAEPATVPPPMPQSEHVEPSPIPAHEPASDHASLDASALASPSPVAIEAVRKTVKQLGKEVAFVRLTPEEKRQLKDIAYTYERQGMKTSENEICRIGINYLLQDYQANGSASILAQALDALNA